MNNKDKSFNEQKFELNRSTEVQEIMNAIPHWTLRWGFPTLFLVLIALFTIIQFIRIPLTIEERATLLKNETNLTVANESQPAKFIAEMHVEQDNLGKLQIGDIALLDFPSYPRIEFGNLVGQLVFIDSIANFNDYKFKLKIAIPSHTITDEKHIIKIKEGMIANTTIVFDEVTLFDKLMLSFFN